MRLRQPETSTLEWEGSVTESAIRRWFAKFRSEEFGLEDEKGRGRKPSIENDQLRTLKESNPQTTVQKLSEELKVSICIISTHLKAIGKVK